MKKIILLGGSTQQIFAIQKAKDLGLYTILCDYLPDNPGKKYADIYYNVSTTNKDEILKIALKNKIDGILAYASDPAALTAAYVATKMDLPTNPYESVEILSKKDKFREFLKNNGFNCPEFNVFSNSDEFIQFMESANYPLIIKPTDSSGSKGVKIINEYNYQMLIQYFNNIINISREKKVIVEKFLKFDEESVVGGDIFVKDGKIAHLGLVNSHHSKKTDGLIPIGNSYPLVNSYIDKESISKRLEKIINILNIRNGPFNVELNFCNGAPYLIELGPRNGGNLIPLFLNSIFGVDLVESTVKNCIGDCSYNVNNLFERNFLCSYVLHTNRNGIFKKLNENFKFKNNIINSFVYKKAGDKILKFDGADKAIGIIFIRLNSMREIIDFFENEFDIVELVKN